MGGISLWVRAEWRRRWPVLVALAVLVAVAGGVATALYAGARRADTALVRFREQTAPYNLEAFVESRRREAVVGRRARSAARGPARRHRRSRRASTASSRFASSRGGASAPSPSTTSPARCRRSQPGRPPPTAARHTPIVLDGALPSPDDADAVVVGEHATDVLGWKVGDRLTFGTVSPDGLFDWFSNDATFGSRDALDGPEIEVEVVAVIRDEADLADDRFPSILFPEGFARAHGDEIAHVEPIAMIRADPTRIDDVADRIEAILDPVGMDVEELPPLGYAGAAVAPTVAVEVTTLWIATAVAADCRALRRRPGRRSSARCRRGRGPDARSRSESRRRDRRRASG